MLIQEVKTKLLAAKLFPISVEAEIAREYVHGLVFQGNLDEFIEAAKALNVTCVFHSTRKLLQSDFLHREIPPRDRWALNSSQTTLLALPIGMDLTAVEPDLAELKTHIDSECGFRLWLQLPQSTLEYLEYQPWWEKFTQLYEQGIEKLLQEQASSEQQELEKQEQANQQILSEIRALLNDSDFVKLPTQRAMQAYAADKIPGVAALNPHMLKAEIQDLDAKVKAKGLGKKK